MAIHIEDFSDGTSSVICDFCNRDGDAYVLTGERGEEFTNYGGIKIGGYMICGHCTEQHEYLKPNGELNMEKFKGDDGEDEDVSDVIVLPAHHTFGDNVRAWRQWAYGTDELKCQFVSFDTSEEMDEYLSGGANSEK